MITSFKNRFLLLIFVFSFVSFFGIFNQVFAATDSSGNIYCQKENYWELVKTGAATGSENDDGSTTFSGYFNLVPTHSSTDTSYDMVSPFTAGATLRLHRRVTEEPVTPSTWASLWNTYDCTTGPLEGDKCTIAFSGNSFFFNPAHDGDPGYLDSQGEPRCEGGNYAITHISPPNHISAAVTYNVNAVIVGSGGSVTSTNPRTGVPANTTTTFTLTPSSGYVVSQGDVTSSDPENCLLNGLDPWSGNTYKTGTINNNCTYSFKFGTVNGSHDGNSGTVASTSCNAHGWASFSTIPGADLTIGILSDGVPVYYGPAGEYRSDLTGQCTGGTCAFNVDLSTRITSGVNHSITVQAQNPSTSAWVTLSGSSKILNCTATPSAPSTPTGLTATPGSCAATASTATINVSWNAPAGATSYTLRDNGVAIPAATGISGTSFSHTGLVAGSSHSYTVLASNATGPSSYSGAVSGTAPAVCAPTDLCGTSSGATPRLTEPTTNPTACNPGTYANSPADTATIGAQAWNWSCGTVTSCTAPKYGCRTTTDSNFSLPQYGLNGPNNVYGCAGTCMNGATDYPTCTPSGMYGTLTAPDCTIPLNGINCTTTVSWNVRNPVIVGGSGVTSSYPSAGTIIAPPVTTGTADVGTKTNVTIPYNFRTFFLSNNGIQLASASPSALCTAGTAWDGSKCATIPVFPDLTASAPTPTTATVGVPQTFSSTITNIGTGSTGAGFTNLFQTSPSSTGASGVVDYPVSGMAALAGSGGSAGTSKSITFSTAGTMYIRACADKSSAGDVNGTISESNEGNNCSISNPWTAVTVSNVSAPSGAPTVTITATPTTGLVNVVSPKITWTTTNDPTSCTASNGDWSGTGSKAAGGGEYLPGVLTSVKTYSYTITCVKTGFPDAVATANVVVTATVVVDVSIVPNKVSIYEGEKVMLNWLGFGTCTATNFKDTVGADNTGDTPGTSQSITATGSSQSVQVSPKITTIYTLTCGSFQDSVELKVKKKPIFIEN